MEFTCIETPKSVESKQAVGFGYDALSSSYINPQDVKRRYPILDISHENIAEAPELQSITLVETASSFEEISKKTSASLSVGGTYNLFTGSISTDYTNTSKTSEESVLSKVMGIYTKRRQYIPHGDNFKSLLHKDFLADLMRMESSDLFDRYGTHLITEVYLGGRMEMNIITSKETSETTNKIGATVKASYGEIFNTESKTEYSKGTKSLLEKSDIRIKAIGGRTISAVSLSEFSKEYREWLNSLESDRNCEVCYLPNTKNSFIPLWELCTDQVKRKEIEREFIKLHAAANNSLIQNDTYVVDIAIMSDAKQSNAIKSCPKGYILIERDLNKDAKGNYIYLCYKLGMKEDAITNFCIDISSNSLPSGKAYITHDGVESTYMRYGSDLNKGARGKYIYLCATKDKIFSPIRRLNVAMDDQKLSEEWYTVCKSGTKQAANCNEGTNGRYLYIMQKN